MKLIEIRLDNFRQFYGKQKIEVSTESERNVTLVHAENGVGKTTLLNALLWCLYGETTGKFERRDKLVNAEALKEGTKHGSVEVLFEHDGSQYVAQRQAYTTKRRTSLRVSVVTSGSYKDIDNPETFVNTVIPSGMAKYFFFDGEQAEAFAGERNNRQVGEAIQTMLGCDVAQTAMQDLDYLSRKLDEALGELPDKGLIRAKEAELQNYLSEQDRWQAQTKELVGKRQVVENELTKLQQELVTIREVAALGRERERLTLEREKGEVRAKELAHRRAKWLANHAVPMVGQHLADTVIATLDQSDLSGIPSPYNEEFVNNLLSKGLCVCGRELVQGSHEYGCVADLLGSAPSKTTQGQALQARAAAAQIHKGMASDWPDLKDIESDRAKVTDSVTECELKLSDIGQKLKDHRLEDVRAKEDAIEKAKEEQVSLAESLGALAEKVAAAQRRVQETKDAIDALVAEDEAGQPLAARRRLCDAAVRRLRHDLAEYKEEARKQITKEVNEILEATAHKTMSARIKDDFSLTLLFGDGNEMPKSGGENQLLSLAFTAALVKFSSERQLGGGDHVLVPGTVAPLMLDSPFGQLDPRYRRSVASFAPAMAPQVILLVSSAQGSDDVVSELRGRVGKEYELRWEDRSQQKTLISGLESP